MWLVDERKAYNIDCGIDISFLILEEGQDGYEDCDRLHGSAPISCQIPQNLSISVSGPNLANVTWSNGTGVTYLCYGVNSSAGVLVPDTCVPATGSSFSFLFDDPIDCNAVFTFYMYNECSTNFQSAASQTVDFSLSNLPDCSDPCNNMVQDPGETGVDCGGSCPPCTPDPSCSDGMQNQGESGVDCGGPCPPCETDTCNNGIQDNGEEGVDCGGPCPPCNTNSCNIGTADPAVSCSTDGFNFFINPVQLVGGPFNYNDNMGANGLVDYTK